MWGIIKKAINSTLGTNKEKPLNEILIKEILNDDYGTPNFKTLDELLFEGKNFNSTEAKENIYAWIEASKTLVVHIGGTIKFKSTDNNFLIYKNNSSTSILPNTIITIAPNDYFDFNLNDANADKTIQIITEVV